MLVPPWMCSLALRNTPPWSLSVWHLENKRSKPGCFTNHDVGSCYFLSPDEKNLVIIGQKRVISNVISCCILLLPWSYYSHVLWLLISINPCRHPYQSTIGRFSHVCCVSSTMPAFLQAPEVIRPPGCSWYTETQGLSRCNAIGLAGLSLEPWRMFCWMCWKVKGLVENLRLKSWSSGSCSAIQSWIHGNFIITSWNMMTWNLPISETYPMDPDADENCDLG